LFFVLLCIFSFSLFAQSDIQKENSAEAAYQKRIIQQNLSGVYISVETRKVEVHPDSINTKQ